eukprot:TRINITY_DN892_c0_g1_i1.p1 TRINITY_DN892_c0_g1~~TRINITY_DN892_c0_g1_i1.p1  ORF type:complete len:221 (+),score=45.19 TRINITY_DN892_c0_g1_i1:748-1410(+)
MIAHGEFVSFMCHESLNPIHAMSGALEFLESAGKDFPDLYRSHVTDIRKSLDYLFHILQDLIELDSFKSGRTCFEENSVHMRSLVNEILNGHEKSARVGCKVLFDSDISSAVPKNVVFDKSKVSKILQKLYKVAFIRSQAILQKDDEKLSRILFKVSVRDGKYLKSKTQYPFFDGESRFQQEEEEKHSDKTLNLMFSVIDNGQLISETQKRKCWKLIHFA